MTTNNLHRELSPVSDAAWAEIQEEAARTFRQTVAGRRIVDMPEARGETFSSLATGHLQEAEGILPGVPTRTRQVLPVMELKVPFTVTRDAVDDVLRGSVDSDWQPVKDAAQKMAAAEDKLVFHGHPGVGLAGMLDASSHAPIRLPEDIRSLPDAVAQALAQLRLAGVEGPYDLVLSVPLYTAVNESTDHGYPVLEHLQRLLERDQGKIIWAPALEGAVLLSERGGDFELHLGTDLSIGYASHDAQTVDLYLYETLVFRVAAPEAAVPLEA